ncbi:MAG: hypothetical protein WBD24_07470 [Candidatus Omnitrophota bacterium]
MDLIVSAVVLTRFGLLISIIGVCLVWAFGLPQKYDAETRAYIAGVELRESEMRRARLHDIAATTGIFLLLCGFLFQLVASYMIAPMYFEFAFRPNY